MSKHQLRVLVVDDSALYRQMIRNVLRDIDDVEVVGVAKDGRDALEQMTRLKPDAITLDYEMPELNGIQVLKRMRRRGIESKAIMVSSYTEEGAKVTTDALFEGAFDFVRKPTTRDPEKTRDQLRAALVDKLSLIGDAFGRSAAVPSRQSKRTLAKSKRSCKAIVIGASTGGPVALRQILSALPGDLAIPVIVVQHMPTRFTAQLARRLNESCQLEVVETAEATRIRAGAIYIAAGGHQTKLVRRNKYVLSRLMDDPPENSCRPSVDYTMRYAAEVFDGHVCGIILTGMGHDGLEGCKAIKTSGGQILAQHPDDCVVYGMPKSVIEADLPDRILKLDEFAEAISKL